jgi:formylglycine-generating enzyme required for sulfatase activity
VAGISDMSGNVWEWTNSWYDTKQMERVQRGGSWLLPEGSSRAASRAGQTPDEKKEFAGFRVARTP